MPKKPKPTIQNKESVDKAVAESVEFLKSKGIAHFILLFQPVPGLTTSHIQEMKVKDALAAFITGLRQTVEMELEQNPTAPANYRVALVEFLQDFKALIQVTNQKIGASNDVPTA